MAKRALLMNERDNVATVLDGITEGDSVAVFLDGKEQKTIVSKSNIEHYHKIAFVPISTDDEVVKYGEIIGKATQSIELGEHVHVNNIESVMTK